MDYYRWRGMSYVKETEDYIARNEGAHSYPWRILAVTEDDTQMPLNNMVYALARENKIGPTDWIKPGKVAWDWWNDWNLRGVDFVAGINYDTYKYYIDFAAAHGLEYIVLDEGWYDSNKANIMQPIEEVRLPELIAYAKSKGVDIVLWTVFNVIDEKLEEACKHYADMGIKGFKVDFLDRNDQTAFEMVERLAECAARHHLMLDLHGIYAPVGLNRTYPNIVNYEGVFGMEEVRWTELKNDMPLYDVTFPYIRMMAGAVDFTPGAMRNGTKEDWAAIYNKPISMGTRCHQAACYIVHDSPFTMLADSPTNYEDDEPYTQYIASLPTVFDETRILQGKMGEYIVTARRLGDTWYIAGQTNWDARDLTIDFSFLTEGKKYKAHLLTDGINAHHDAEDYRLSTMNCSSTTQQAIHLAPGGGFVIKLNSLP
jgi:alpha-glucosidase